MYHPTIHPILFIDRDGVILQEPPTDHQVDSLDKTTFVPGAITALSKIAKELDYKKVLITNQDGLGTASFPEDHFYPYQNLMLRTLAGEGFLFDEVLVDKTFAHQNAPTRKPGTALLRHYLDERSYNIAHSFVIGDRITDMQLAYNIGCKGILMRTGNDNNDIPNHTLQSIIALETNDWNTVYQFLKQGHRTVTHQRITHETRIHITLNVDGTGDASINTGLGFFDHMLAQIAKHGNIDITITVQGDLHIDEHHTIEDTGIALGEALAKALVDKRGMERYGFALPMDDAAAQVLIDFGGRSWLVWEASFTREKIGDMPTEMFFHFFKSLSDAAKCNLNIVCTGNNEHHKIEAIFKAFGKAIKMAVRKDPVSNALPSTKGLL